MSGGFITLDPSILLTVVKYKVNNIIVRDRYRDLDYDDLIDWIVIRMFSILIDVCSKNRRIQFKNNVPQQKDIYEIILDEVGPAVENTFLEYIRIHRLTQLRGMTVKTLLTPHFLIMAYDAEIDRGL